MINIEKYQDKFQHKDILIILKQIKTQLASRIIMQKKLDLMKSSSILIELNGVFDNILSVPFLFGNLFKIIKLNLLKLKNQNETINFDQMML